jgi:PhnB protein
MKLNTYLFFDGNCEAAITFYERCLGGKIEAMMRYDGSPAEQQVPAEWRNRILHACLIVGNNMLMASDCPPGRFDRPQGFSATINVPEPAEAERVFEALAKDGTVTMPMEKTFWSARFGMLVDRFGIPWMVNCDQAS